MYPSGLVLAARDEVRTVGAELQVRDGVAMRVLVELDFVACLRVEERNLARLVPSDDDVGPVRECTDDSF